MVTKERFTQGMTFQQYLDQMTTNKEKFLQNMADVKLRPEDKAPFANRREKLNVLVITEDWCGDAITNFPVLARMVEGAPNVGMRVFLRDRNPDLMDQYLNQGMFRSIPVFVFFDDQMNELARFIERPPSVTDYMEKKQLELRRAMREEKKDEWRQAAVDELKTLLKA
ncbi:MAG TPA: thioredoxin family protein [Methylomirabilota bacterium]|nr:thioredoxin family protein [Methylomirabilota bacterium]